MEVMGDWWWGGLAGQLLVALFAPAAAILIAATALRGGSTRAAWIAALVYLSTPWIYRLAVIAYVEGPLCFYHAALVWAAVRGWARSRDRAAADLGTARPAGRLCDGLQVSGLDLGGDSVRSCSRWSIAGGVDRSRPWLCYVLGWAVVMGPWLGKNVIDTGNPVYPLADTDLPRPLLGPGPRDEVVRRATARKPITARSLWSSLVDVAGRSDWQSPLYVALAPLALLASRIAPAGAGRSGDSWPTCS